MKTQLFYPKEIKAQKFNFSFYYSQETNKNTTFINPKYPEAKTHTNHQNNQELETKHKKSFFTLFIKLIQTIIIKYKLKRETKPTNLKSNVPLILFAPAAENKVG